MIKTSLLNFKLRNDVVLCSINDDIYITKSLTLSFYQRKLLSLERMLFRYYLELLLDILKRRIRELDRIFSSVSLFDNDLHKNVFYDT